MSKKTATETMVNSAWTRWDELNHRLLILEKECGYIDKCVRRIEAMLLDLKLERRIV